MSKELFLAVDCYQDEANPNFKEAIDALTEFKTGDIANLWHVAAQRMFGKVIYLPVLSTAETPDQCVKDMEEYTFSYFYGVYGENMPTEEQMAALANYCIGAIRNKLAGGGAMLLEAEVHNKGEDSISHYATLLFMILIGRIQPDFAVNQELKTILLPLEI